MTINPTTLAKSNTDQALIAALPESSRKHETEIGVLLIEDNPDDAFFIEDMLSQTNGNGPQFSLTHAKKLEAGLAFAAQKTNDIILLDLDLPDSCGLETFRAVQTQITDTPIVVLSGLNSETLSIEAVAKGAQDYLVKGKVDHDLLIRTIRYAIERNRTAKEQQCLLLAERAQRVRAETMREVTLALTSKTSHGAVLDEILRQVQRIAPYTTAHIMLLERDLLRTARWRGHDIFGAEEYISNLVQKLPDLPMDADAVRSQSPVVISDTARELRWVMLAQTNWIRSHITVPICHRSRVLGLLRLDSDQVNAFTAEHAEALQPLANAAAIAMENARLYEQARQDAETKAALLQEVNHRVKNNLSAIIGLLYAERRYANVKEGDPYWETMKELVNRVQGLATVHNLLSASEWQPLLLSQLIQQVIDADLQSLPRTKKMAVEITPSLIRVNSGQANHVALLINELVTNSIKYALTDRNEARVTVRLVDEEDAILLEYRDDGPGYAEAALRMENYSVGLYLLQTLVRDGLRGTLSIYNENGAVTAIRFSPVQ